MGVLEIFVGCPGIFDRCPGYIWWVSLRYVTGVLEISLRVLSIFDLCIVDI